jgi:hypothetical protein
MNGLTLVVYERHGDFGRLEILQQDLHHNEQLVDEYRQINRESYFASAMPHEPENKFVEFKNGAAFLRRQPELNARLDKARIRVGEIARVRGVPRGATVLMSDGLNSESYTADGGILEFASPYPGRWQVQIDAPPHAPQLFRIECF